MRMIRASWSSALLLTIGCSAASDFGYSFAGLERDAGPSLDAAMPGVDGGLDAARSEAAVPDTDDAAADGGQRVDGHVDASADAGCALSEASELTCSGGRDEDCDGLADCADPDCRQSATCCPAPTFESGDVACADAVDNDCDGLLDCADTGCSGVYLCVCGPAQTEGISLPGTCVDGRDNDCDRLIDCQEPSCAPSLGCCTKSAELEVGASCTDGLNNDCDIDGADCADPDCRMSAMGATERETGTLCRNQLDDDCDGVKDCEDPDCSGALECCVSTEATEVSCGDGKNNDCDQQGADCDDPDCSALAACCRASPENHERACSDGIDNDCDGPVDCADPNCRPFGDCCVQWLRKNGIALVKSEEGFCGDAFDNDCDGAANCKDSDCNLYRGCGLIFEAGGGTVVAPITTPVAAP